MDAGARDPDSAREADGEAAEDAPAHVEAVAGRILAVRGAEQVARAAGAEDARVAVAQAAEKTGRVATHF